MNCFTLQNSKIMTVAHFIFYIHEVIIKKTLNIDAFDNLKKKYLVSDWFEQDNDFWLKNI